MRSHDLLDLFHIQFLNQDFRRVLRDLLEKILDLIPEFGNATGQGLLEDIRFRGRFRLDDRRAGSILKTGDHFPVNPHGRRIVYSGIDRRIRFRHDRLLDRLAIRIDQCDFSQLRIGKPFQRPLVHLRTGDIAGLDQIAMLVVAVTYRVMLVLQPLGQIDDGRPHKTAVHRLERQQEKGIPALADFRRTVRITQPEIAPFRHRVNALCLFVPDFQHTNLRIIPRFRTHSLEKASGISGHFALMAVNRRPVQTEPVQALGHRLFHRHRLDHPVRLFVIPELRDGRIDKQMFRHDTIDHQSFDLGLFIHRGHRLPDLLLPAVGIAAPTVLPPLHRQAPRTHQIVLRILNTGMNQRVGMYFPLIHHLQDTERTGQRRPDRRLGPLLQSGVFQITVRHRLDRLAQQLQIARSVLRLDGNLGIACINPRQNPHDGTVDQIGPMHVKPVIRRIAVPVQSGNDLPVMPDTPVEPVPVTTRLRHPFTPLPGERIRLGLFPEFAIHLFSVFQ